MVAPLIVAADLPGRLPEAAHRHRQPGGRAHHVRRPEEGPPARGGGGQVSACSRPQPVDDRGRARSTKIDAPTIEYAQLAPTLIVVGAAIIGVLVEAFVPRKSRYYVQVFLVRRRAGRRLRRGRRPRGRRIRHHQGAASRRWAPSPSTDRPCSCRARSCWPRIVARLHLRRAAARPGGARQPRRLLRRAGRLRARQRQREGRRQGRVHHHRGLPAGCCSRSPAC